MAVSLGFLGQASKQAFSRLPAGATPRVLGSKTPKTPKTPASALAFFEDFAPPAKTPKTLFNQAPPTFFSDALALSPKVNVASHHVSFLCDASPLAASPLRPQFFPAGRRPQPSEKPQADAGAGAKSARDAFLARRGRVMERGTGAEQLPLRAEGPPSLFPTLLRGGARRAERLAAAEGAAEEEAEDAAAAAARAREAFLAKRRHQASRSASSFGAPEEPPAASEQPAHGYPMLLGQAPPQPAAPAARPEAVAGPEGARDAYLARRQRIQERAALMVEAPKAAAGAVAFPTLLRREARLEEAERAAAANAAASFEPKGAASCAAAARDLFLARRQQIAGRQAAFVV